MADLTPRQARFVEEYAIDLNATQAAIRAGYGEAGAHVHACRMLSKPNIAEAVQHALEARSERAIVTQDDVLRGLLREATLEGEGAHHGARVSAWTALAKHLGLIVDRKQTQQLGADGKPVNPGAAVVVVQPGPSLDEMLAMAAAKAKR